MGLIAIALFASFCSEPVDLRTGNWFFDTVREVTLDEFEHSYVIRQVEVRGRFIEFQDGSVWQVNELSPECSSFYDGQGIEIDYIESQVSTWHAGESVILHKLSDRESVVLYNTTKNQVVDAVPFMPPLQPKITVDAVDNSRRLVVLSDQSMWSYTSMCPCQPWEKGDPVVIAKDTPYWGDNTHVLINMAPCDCEATVEHIHPNRVGVKQVTTSAGLDGYNIGVARIKTEPAL